VLRHDPVAVEPDGGRQVLRRPDLVDDLLKAQANVEGAFQHFLAK
jgi:hypothetical protein